MRGGILRYLLTFRFRIKHIRNQDRIISLYTDEQLKELSEADELNHLSSHTLRALFKKSCSAKANEQSRA